MRQNHFDNSSIVSDFLVQLLVSRKVEGVGLSVSVVSTTLRLATTMVGTVPSMFYVVQRYDHFVVATTT
jgi:hypothetical protein